MIKVAFLSIIIPFIPFATVIILLWLPGLSHAIALDGFYFRWIENGIIELGKAESNPDVHPSKLEPLLDFGCSDTSPSKLN